MPTLPRTPSRRTIAALVTVVVAGAVAAVLLVVTSGSSTGTSARPTVTGSGPAHQGDPAPVFTGTALDGSHVDLAALRGHPVIVNFFATWCTNCRAEMPLLQSTWQRDRGRGLEVVAIGFHETGDGAAFARSLGVTFPTVLDPASTVGTAYGVTDLPESVFVRADGRVDTVFHGQLSDDTLGPELQTLLR